MDFRISICAKRVLRIQPHAQLNKIYMRFVVRVWFFVYRLLAQMTHNASPACVPRKRHVANVFMRVRIVLHMSVADCVYYFVFSAIPPFFVRSLCNEYA